MLHIHGSAPDPIDMAVSTERLDGPVERILNYISGARPWIKITYFFIRYAPIAQEMYGTLSLFRYRANSMTAL